MPAEKNPDVMEMVRKAIENDPDVETAALFEKAREMDSSLEDLSLRQFHARYPLQVKRKLSSARKKKDKKKAKKKAKKRSGGRSSGSRGKKKSTSASGGATAGEDGRQAIREGLLRFAKDVAAAEDKADLITVLTSVDDYVDEVAAALETS
jgi:hypothetical protein